MGFIATEKVIDVVHQARRGGKLYRSQPGDREFATVIEGICANGSALDPMIIFKAKDFCEEWFEDVPDIPQNLLFGKSSNGWTDKKMSLRWLTAKFGPSSATKKKAGERYRILLSDGYNSHINISFLEYCINNKAIPICLPPHTSDHLQSLDISVFSTYQHAYRAELQDRFESHDRGVGKRNFYQIISKVRPIALTPEIITSGFWHSGIIPSDGSIILDRLPNEHKARHESPSPNKTTISPVCELSNLEVSEVKQMPSFVTCQQVPLAVGVAAM
ncbi:DDE-domain-containing protein [Choiromyces venosus 120613-1]|uniref:DDE-domain-containing protein n=1 Tax=Choiromyces venosus 120613-1 TaxID=1336337 RepID=A0A3N4JA64_9PEZI|nr:DDE-domain-containing protein [Choiromyces venosus 120613-1]RPA90705.1 DDE-domain-containing protein [Choiromyces venosus 120613-1]